MLVSNSKLGDFALATKICLLTLLCPTNSLGLPAQQIAVQEKSTPSWTKPEEFLALQNAEHWPEAKAEHKPGAIWWWPASAVSKSDLTWNLETYSQAGWGNMGIVGIYGVKGEEDRTIELFSPKWFEMYNHTNQEARRLGINLDLTPGGGWRWGGPHVTEQYADQKFAVRDGLLIGDKLKEKVKRAGPGGMGLTVNPYSNSAVRFHLDWFDDKLKANEALAPRAFYYDSFENSGNWCDEFLQFFEMRRGYSLTDHASALDGEAKSEDARRVLSDYRATLSEMLIERMREIAEWGAAKGSKLRIQAHGAPANLLDLYAAGSIPETEVFGASKFDIPGFRREGKWIRADQQSDLVNRFASSAAHVAGHPVTTSESFTWLRNHYHTALSHIKAEADGLLLNGINGIYYHGACFSPESTEWPGWLFYASTQANPRNSIFRDVPILNSYITRCQSILQSGRPHNDILLYWPIHDLWMGGGKGDQRYTVHHPEWIEKTSCGEVGRHLLEHGYTFDFVSDLQITKSKCENGEIATEGNSRYQTILIPATRHIPLTTAKKIVKLAESGATIIIWKALPNDVPGWFEHDSRRDQLAQIWNGLGVSEKGVAKIGKGKVIIGTDLDALLADSGVIPERMTDLGLEFIRRTSGKEVQYFVVNHTPDAVDDWVPLATDCDSALLLDPMNGRVGVAKCKTGNVSSVYLQMQPGDTRILRVGSGKKFEAEPWVYSTLANSIEVNGEWNLKFVDGGPKLPADATLNQLESWTKLENPDVKSFAGTGRYSIEIEVPELDEVEGWVLDLGDVRESARVWLNGKPIGVVVAHPYRIDLGGGVPAGKNKLEIEVTNLSANRIRELDRRGVKWKKFHDINFVSHLYRPFDASKWDLKPSGLLGPVKLISYKDKSRFEVATLHLIGDSTVKTGQGKGGKGQWGWGSVIDQHFDSSKIKVANHAIGGLSSRTYLTGGHWEKVRDDVHPGDFVLMQFGHNDGGEKFLGNRPRASINGNSDESIEGIVELTGKKEVVHSYGWYLRQFISDIKIKGATPIVLSPVPRKRWENGRIHRTADDYTLWAREAAASSDALFVDLNDIVATHYEALGKAKLKNFLLTNTPTHRWLALK